MHGINILPLCHLLRFSCLVDKSFVFDLTNIIHLSSCTVIS